MVQQSTYCGVAASVLVEEETARAGTPLQGVGIQQAVVRHWALVQSQRHILGEVKQGLRMIRSPNA